MLPSNLADRDLPPQNLLNAVQPESQFAQSPNKLYSTYGLGAVQAVSAIGSTGRRYHSDIRPEADRPNGQTGAPGDLPDGEKRFAFVHEGTMEPPVTGESSLQTDRISLRRRIPASPGEYRSVGGDTRPDMT